MDSGRSTRALPRVGFPIRKSPDQRMVSSFPGLIAAAHVLRRLLAPRHPPCALVLLIRKNTSTTAMEFSRCARAGCPPFEEPLADEWSLKAQQRAAPSGAGNVEVDVIPGEPGHRTAGGRATVPSTSRAPAGVRAPAFPRKEVIQPHLPVRLPCYDFTPIIDPTFDGCLLAVSSPASGIADFRGVTGGVYKPRERIHRDVADPRLLATPPS